MKHPAPRFARLSIGLSFYSFAMVGLNVGANGVVLKSLSSFYHIGDAVLGSLFFASYLSYTLSSFFCGPLAERLSLRWLLALGTLLFLLGTLGYILKVPFALLLVFCFCMGLGTGIVETGFNIFVSALPGRNSLLGALHAFYGVGTIFGPLLATGLLALFWGWNTIYMALALLNLLQLGGVIFLLDRPNATEGTPQLQPRTEHHAFRKTLTMPLVWLTSLFLLVYSGVEVCAGSWGYTYLIDQRSLGTLTAGWVVGGFGVGLTLGRFLIQPLAERKGLGTVPLMYLLICGILLSLALTWLVPSALLASIGFCLLGLSLAPIYPLIVALVPTLVPEPFVPNAIGIVISVSIGGLALLPWLAGLLAQWGGIGTLMPYLLGLTLIMFAFWLYLARPVSRSEAVQKELAVAETLEA